MTLRQRLEQTPSHQELVGQLTHLSAGLIVAEKVADLKEVMLEVVSELFHPGHELLELSQPGEMIVGAVEQDCRDQIRDCLTGKGFRP